MKDDRVKGEERNRGVKMNLKEIKKEKTVLIEEKNRLRKGQKELVKQEKEQKEKDFRKVAIPYVSIEPASYTIDEKLNPMNIHSPKMHNSTSITLPNVYVKVIGKACVAIKPLEEVGVQK